MASMSKTKKPSQGRRKIEIKKIEVKNHQQVTFSKRRVGLFNKASELCVLCGAEIAIICFSQAGKVFSFGHPSTDSVIERYINGGLYLDPVNNDNNPLFIQFKQKFRELEALKQAEIGKAKGSSGQEVNDCDNQFWWDESIEDMGLQDLEQFMVSLEGLVKNVDLKAEEMILENSSSLQLSGVGPSGGQDCFPCGSVGEFHLC
ncbi:Transcription factor, MADS-box [Dillenia turbinata]|uniref:Transcription factor, MADS-box n=1 Tax=Dillenia turbinata TaxID=194707 RepID=A0AAN8VCQ3_9MAGN